MSPLHFLAALMVESGMNFYAVLGIPRDADEETIRSAYRMLARRYHPDRGAGSCLDTFRRVTEAYETLIDQRRRHEYDLSLPRHGRPLPVWADNMTAPSDPFRQEDAAIFGRMERAQRGVAARHSPGLDELFDKWFNDFFGAD